MKRTIPRCAESLENKAREWIQLPLFFSDVWARSKDIAVVFVLMMRNKHRNHR